MADGVALAVAEGGEVRAEQVGVEAVALDRDDVVVLDAQAHRLADVGLEREVDVAGREHDDALDAVRGGERQAQPARPVRDRAGLGGDAGRPGAERALEPRREIGAGGRGHAHLRGRLEQRHAALDACLERRVVGVALEVLGVLVADHQHARAAAQDLAELGRVQQALDGAVDHEVGRRQRGDRAAVAGQRAARRPSSAAPPGRVFAGVGTTTS